VRRGHFSAPQPQGSVSFSLASQKAGFARGRRGKKSRRVADPGVMGRPVLVLASRDIAGRDETERLRHLPLKEYHQ